MDALAVDDLTAHTSRYEKMYEPGVLIPEYHYRLVTDLPGVCAVAGIHPRFVYTSMKKLCSDVEMNWVKTLRNHDEEGIAGLVFTGHVTRLEDRMMAIAGACLRNFVDARLMTVQDCISNLKAEEMPNPKVLLIPNFFYSKASGGHVPAWQVSMVFGMLMNRYLEGKSTVLYVENVTTLATEYGPAIKDHIDTKYVRA